MHFFGWMIGGGGRVLLSADDQGAEGQEQAQTDFIHEHELFRFQILPPLARPVKLKAGTQGPAFLHPKLNLSAASSELSPPGRR